MTCANLSTNLLRDLYTKMLLTRIIDERVQYLHSQGSIDFCASCRGHEAIQVGSAACIEVGQDFTLPYYRDLGVVLTIGMTPYEVFRTYLQSYHREASSDEAKCPHTAATHHWSYHKHNTITGPTPTATQLLHAAGIAFASKLRKASVVTIAYCDTEATREPDFAEAIRFAAQHTLPVVFLCENNGFTDVSTKISTNSNTEMTAKQRPSCLQDMTLPTELAYQRIDGIDIVTVYSAMRQVMERARSGAGPTLLEMMVPATISPSNAGTNTDPLARGQHQLQCCGAWDEEWANRLSARLKFEIEHALEDALRDTPLSREEESRAEL